MVSLSTLLVKMAIGIKALLWNAGNVERIVESWTALADAGIIANSIANARKRLESFAGL